MPVGDHAPPWSDGLLEGGFGSPRATAILGWPARIVRMLDVEVALARAQASLGLIPAEAADAIASACTIERLDLSALAEATRSAATPVIALLRRVTDGADPLVAAHLHLGATSQDVVDTATAMQVREALALLEAELIAAGDAAAELTVSHRETVQAGRTLGQQAVPITVGLRAARWLGALDRRVEQLRAVRDRVVVLQFGGAAGTLSGYGDEALELAAALGTELDLPVPDLPWHADRDRDVELAGMLAGVTAVVEDVAADIVRCSATEVGELAEAAPGGPGSSAMPHKRNPVHATAARAAARLARGELGVLLATDGHEHERAAGAWQAGWVALPSALVRATGAVERLRASLLHLEVDADRARRNLDVGLGLTGSEALASALASELGRARAQALVGELAAEAAQRDTPLADVAAGDERVSAVLDRDAVDRALAPETSLRHVGPLIDRALARHRSVSEVAG